MMLVIAAVVVGLRCLPYPLTLVNAFLVPSFHVLGQTWPRLRAPLCRLMIVSLIPVLFLPALRTGDPWDWNMAVAASVLSLPLIGWSLTFWSGSDTWEILDPLVVICLPFTGFFLFAVVVRMFETRVLTWR
jgi:hypothetical protein